MELNKELQTIPEQKPVLHAGYSMPHFNWPTSKPGPLATQPPPGQKPMLGRTEQVVEIGYNQETGEPGTAHPARYLPDESLQGKTGFDQLETAPTPGIRKKRRK